MLYPSVPASDKKSNYLLAKNSLVEVCFSNKNIVKGLIPHQISTALKAQ
jgi:hypothetical protein